MPQVIPRFLLWMVVLVVALILINAGMQGNLGDFLAVIFTPSALGGGADGQSDLSSQQAGATLTQTEALAVGRVSNTNTSSSNGKTVTL